MRSEIQSRKNNLAKKRFAGKFFNYLNSTVTAGRSSFRGIMMHHGESRDASEVTRRMLTLTTKEKINISALNVWTMWECR